LVHASRHHPRAPGQLTATTIASILDRFSGDPAGHGVTFSDPET
jgi:hypothetical protein